MFDVIALLKALSDENRIRMLMALRGKELCVCTLTELLDLAPSTTSKHLSILKQARLIESVKDGKFVYYRLSMEGSPHHALAGPALEWLAGMLENTAQIAADRQLLRQIIEKGEEVCSKYAAASNDHMVYRHVPGIHAKGDFGGK